MLRQEATRSYQAPLGCDASINDTSRINKNARKDGLAPFMSEYLFFQPRDQ